MKRERDNMNGILVFNEPIKFGEKDIVYGILFNEESKEFNEENEKSLSEYVEYLAGMAQVCKYGVPIEDDKGWSFPMKKITVNCDTYSLATLIGIFFKDMVKFKTFTFNEPIVWETDEVYKGNCNLIINDSLINRYIDTN